MIHPLYVKVKEPPSPASTEDSLIIIAVIIIIPDRINVNVTPNTTYNNNHQVQLLHIHRILLRPIHYVIMVIFEIIQSHQHQLMVINTKWRIMSMMMIFHKLLPLHIIIISILTTTSDYKSKEISCSKTKITSKSNG